METIDKQPCPMCKKNAMTLTEDQREVPYFGKVYLFSMTCSECKYHKADVEYSETNEPCKWTLEIDSEEDMKIRVIKSSHGMVKIPHLMSIEPNDASNGFVTNVEGILRRMKGALESAKEDAEDASDRKKIKNMLKKLQKIMWGREKVKLIVEDPSGNSAIVSDKAVKGKYKK